MGIWYRLGTVAVTSGNAVVTGTLTVWLTQAKAGDTFSGPDGKDYEILTVDNNTQITLATTYSGSTVSGSTAYAIKPYSPLRSAVATLSSQISNFLQTVKGIYGGTGAPSNSLGNDGDYYFRDDVPTLHKKTSGTWDVGTSLVGTHGPIGPGFSTTSTSSNSIGTGTKVFTIAGTAGLSYLGARMRAARTSASSNFMEGIVTAATSTTLTITVDITGGSGTFTDWSLVAAGEKGAQGPAGAASTGISSSSVVIGTGTKTFTVPSGLDLAVGQRVRFVDQANPSTNFVEGPITSYSGGSMSISSDRTGGSGTIASWSFGIVGAIGATGATGAASTVPGPTGPSYAGTSTTSVVIGTGNKTLTTQTGLAYLPGARARASDQSNAATNYIEGEVTAYNSSTGSMTIAVDLIGGSGTLTAWNINLAGDRGTPGANGTSFTFQGTYSGGTSYAVNDVVIDQNSSWVALVATTGNAPPTLPTTSNTQWSIMAKAGVDGTGAVNSVNGASGDVVIDATAVDVASGFTPARYTPAGAQVQQHLAGIDSALATAGLNQNMLINGDGAINQRAVASNADDTYGPDRWNILTQTGAVAVTTLADVANGVPSLIRITQSQATAQRAGACQILEAKDSKLLRGSVVSLSGKCRLSAGGNVRFAILEWTGTADVVTSDVVLSWTNASIAANAFFLASGITVAGTGVLTVAAATVTDFSLPNITISGSCNNLIVMVWSEATMVQTAALDWRAKLEPAAAPSPWYARPYCQELAMCQRYFFAIAYGVVDLPIANMTAAGTTAVWGKVCDLPNEMRVAPTATLSAIGHFRPYTAAGGAAAVFTSGGIDKTTKNSLLSWAGFGGSSGLVGGNSSNVATANAAAKISADAEL